MGEIPGEEPKQANPNPENESKHSADEPTEHNVEPGAEETPQEIEPAEVDLSAQTTQRFTEERKRQIISEMVEAELIRLWVLDQAELEELRRQGRIPQRVMDDRRWEKEFKVLFAKHLPIKPIPQLFQKRLLKKTLDDVGRLLGGITIKPQNPTPSEKPPAAPTQGTESDTTEGKNTTTDTE